ncbi:MAG: diguanylate cyclase [Proteobacteria bacterium]|nr:diguanylate cyclase [Pseudomonadota bacterium]
MTAYDPSLHRPRSGILSWLGLGRETEQDATSASPEAEAVPVDPLRAARLRHVGDIGQFLAVHDLEVTPYTLAVAHDFLTGEDPQMGRAIEARIQAGEPLSVEWLEQAGRDGSAGGERRALSVLMTRLESNLDEFSRTSSAAKSAATDYSTALESQVNGLQGVENAGEVISELANLAAAMLNRTRELEKEMSRSELQAKTLRRNLDQAKRSAEEDHLTGLPNRRAFEGLLKSEHAAAQAAKEHLCVAFCDIDHFKRINDTHGHDAGDRVLKAVAQTLAKISNDKCHVARHGGEEFVVLLRGKSVNEAWEVLDGAREAMADRRLVNRASDMPFGQVTFSGGIADVFAHGDPRVALKAADEALYRAKAEGRNRIHIAPRAG